MADSSTLMIIDPFGWVIVWSLMLIVFLLSLLIYVVLWR